MRRCMGLMAAALLLGCAPDPIPAQQVDVPATQAAVASCLTTRLDVPLRLPDPIPPITIVWVAPDQVPRGYSGWTDFDPLTITIADPEWLAHELVHAYLAIAGLDAAANAAHEHPAFARCGGADWIRYA